MSETTDIRTRVRERYGAIAEGDAAAAGCCGGPSTSDAVLPAIGYTEEQAGAVPEGANLGLGCGNPLAYAQVKPGETVLDLGSGAGIDCFLAAREVGPTGRVIGVDMTPAMLEKARAHAAQANAANVEFRLGEIEHLPVADASVDLVISNCVVNLSPDKPQVFREAFRALKPGGRMVVSDLVLTKPLPPEVKESVDAYVGCVAGASLKEDYLAMMRGAGFTGVEVVEEFLYAAAVDTGSGCCVDRDSLDAVVSVKVKARKA